MNKNQGTVKSLRKDGKSVCIIVDLATGPVESWLDLAENIKPNYIKVGSKCEFSYVEQDNGNPLLTFIKCDQAKTYTPSQKPDFKSGDKYDPVVSEQMIRMSALKASGAVFSGSSKEADFKRLTQEIVEYIKGGLFSDEKELVQKSELPLTKGSGYY